MAFRETLEREVKLRAGEEFRLPELGGEAIEPRLFVSTYHDTSDHRLARRGVTLRHRLENGKGLWQLKLPRGRARLELEHPGLPNAAPDELVVLLAGHLRGKALAPIARLRTRREGVRADGAEIVHDTVAVLDHQKVTRSFEELEVELLDGDEKTLRRIEKALRRAGAGVKRARYAAELRGADTYVSAAKRLQDVLGEHQDAVVAQERLRRLAVRLPAAAVAAGRLVERERARAERGRDNWWAAWKRLAKTA